MVTSDRLDFQRGVQTDPLNDHDIQLIHRYLSDPTVFPREFKKWITEHSSDTVDISKSQVHGLINDSGQVVIGSASMAMLGSVMVGCLFPYASTTAPAGWLICDGREMVRTEYKALFDLIGSFGTPSAGDKFKLPDLRGRAPFGYDSNVPFGGNGDGRAPGTRGPTHHHRTTTSPGVSISGNTGNDAVGHQHNLGGGVAVGAGPINALGAGDAFLDKGIVSNHWHPFTGSGVVNIDAFTDNGQQGPKDTVGWLGLNWIIGSGKLP